MRVKKYLSVTALSVIAVTVLLPILFTFSASLMSNVEISRNFGDASRDGSFTPFHIFPSKLAFDGYLELLIRNPNYLMRFWISLGICMCISSGQLIISILGGYAFSKFRFPLRDVIFYCIIILMMLPYQVTVVPTYIVIRELGLINSYVSLILPSIFSAFGVFLMRQVMSAIPDSILEAAKLDGANTFTALYRVLVPCCSSGIAALTVLSFVDAWNMVEQPIVFIKDTFKQPLSVFLLAVNGENMALGFACGVIMIIPVLFLLLFFEKQLVSGIGYSVMK